MGVIGRGFLVMDSFYISHLRTKMSDDVKHTFAWTIERFSERQEPNSQVGQTL